MAKLLYITANPKPVEQSLGLSVGETFLEAYLQENPKDEVIRLDLYKAGVPHIDTDVFNGWGKLQQGSAFEHLTADEKDKVSRINKLTDLFISADKYVFVTPMWNFNIPPIMKAFIDTICIAGKTFKYTEQGAVGLLTDKSAVHIQARGGIYSEGPAKDFEFGDRYIRAIFSFTGIRYVDSVIIEGSAQFPEQTENIKAKAMERAREVAKKLAAQTVSV